MGIARDDRFSIARRSRLREIVKHLLFLKIGRGGGTTESGFCFNAQRIVVAAAFFSRLLLLIPLPETRGSNQPL
jgi:hypothetical protein